MTTNRRFHFVRDQVLVTKTVHLLFQWSAKVIFHYQSVSSNRFYGFYFACEEKGDPSCHQIVWFWKIMGIICYLVSLNFLYYWNNCMPHFKKGAVGHQRGAEWARWLTVRGLEINTFASKDQIWTKSRGCNFAVPFRTRIHRINLRLLPLPT